MQHFAAFSGILRGRLRNPKRSFVTEPLVRPLHECFGAKPDC